MLNYDEITVEVPPGCIDRFLIGSCKNDRSFRRGMDEGSSRVGEFDPVMRLAGPVGSGAIAIDRIDEIVSRRLDGSLEDEMTVGGAKLGSKWIAGRLGYCCDCRRNGWSDRWKW